LSTQISTNSENNNNNNNNIDENEEDKMCGLIHNDCHRSIINKFFEFYNINENQNEEKNIDKDLLIESFKAKILDYLNRNKIDDTFNWETKYKFKYYQGMNDLIIFFIILEKMNNFNFDKKKIKKNKKANKNYFTDMNREIISYLKSENNSLNNNTQQINFSFNLHNFLDFVFQRYFKPFCYIKVKINNFPFDNSNLFIDHKKNSNEFSNSLKMKKILPTVIKYIEIINLKVKRRLFDLTKIDPFYSLGWILTWFSHNNENIFKNFRIIDYLLYGEINTIFYLVAVVK